MSVDTLSQLAMERASTAREAVALMGVCLDDFFVPSINTKKIDRGWC